MNCSFTELWLYCNFTELWLYFTVTLLNCDFTLLWLYWTVTLLYWPLTLWLYWTVTWLYWPLTLLRCRSYIGSFWAKLPLIILYTSTYSELTQGVGVQRGTFLHAMATLKPMNLVPSCQKIESCESCPWIGFMCPSGRCRKWASSSSTRHRQPFHSLASCRREQCNRPGRR